MTTSCCVLCIAEKIRERPCPGHRRRDGDQTKTVEVDRKMRDYQAYLEELFKRFPQSYHKMKTFMQRGSCRCGTLDDRKRPCECANTGKACVCSHHIKYCELCPSGCQTGKVEDTVRVYDIDPKGEKLDDFVVDDKFHVSNQSDLYNLKVKLATDVQQNNQTERDSENDEHEDEGGIFDTPEPCRVITVSHLSPEIILLLGGIYDIAADFFNRHLPGTEAISGRLISRLPSTVQIDLDELYEGTKPFSCLFPKSRDVEGYKKIDEAIKRNFLFRVGWDYFPVTDMDWEESRRNSTVSSGYEVLMEDDLRNVFQFNLAHRISVYSQPPRHKKTAILIFYPNLPMKKETKDQGGKATMEPIEFRSIPNMLPSPSQLHQILEDDAENNWESEAQKQSYGLAFHRNFRLHLKKHYREHERMKKSASESAQKHMKIRDYSTFVHLFAAPLFKIVAANWARLIVRRSFDLDLLEWRPKERVTSRTTDEIKSRRIAITRHQRDINSSMEVLRALMLEEREHEIQHGDTSKKTLAQVRMAVDSMTDWNRGRSNGLVSEEAKDDSSGSIFWDFVELKASIDALEKRASQIQDGLCGQIQVVGGEKAGVLNWIAFSFTIILLPFSIVGTIYGASLKHGEREAPLKQPSVFVKAMGLTFLAIIATMGILNFLASRMWGYTVKFKVKELGRNLGQWTVDVFHHRKLKRNVGRWQTDA